jgi:hypothetical protein
MAALLRRTEGPHAVRRSILLGTAQHLAQRERSRRLSWSARIGQHGIHFAQLLPVVEHACRRQGRATASLSVFFPTSPPTFTSFAAIPVLSARPHSLQLASTFLRHYYFHACGCRCYNLLVAFRRCVTSRCPQHASSLINGGMVQGSARQVLNLKTRVRFPVPLPNSLA